MASKICIDAATFHFHYFTFTAAGSLAFYILGAALMFGTTKATGWFGWGGLGMPTLANGEGAWDWTLVVIGASCKT